MQKRVKGEKDEFAIVVTDGKKLVKVEQAD